MPSSALIVLLRTHGGTLTPTGLALLRLVQIQGDRMLAQTVREDYKREKEVYLELLVLAERDAVAGPILIAHVQRILDEESQLFHNRNW